MVETVPLNEDILGFWMTQFKTLNFEFS